MRRQALDDAAPAGVATSPYTYQEEQALCQRLLGLPVGRKRLGDSTRGEAGHGDEPLGAKATLPTGGHHANMWARPEMRIQGRAVVTCQGG